MLHVTDVEAALRFYVDRLGFTSAWRYEEEGKPIVAQMQRDGCALILVCTWAEKAGKGTMFISLNTESPTNAELTGRGAQVVKGGWGYRVVMVTDPDGNALLFNYTD